MYWTIRQLSPILILLFEHPRKHKGVQNFLSEKSSYISIYDKTNKNFHHFIFQKPRNFIVIFLINTWLFPDYIWNEKPHTRTLIRIYINIWIWILIGVIKIFAYTGVFFYCLGDPFPVSFWNFNFDGRSGASVSWQDQGHH